MYEFSKGSIFYKITKPLYSKQDLGISPKGASDQLSFEIGYTLLGSPKKFVSHEIIHTKKITFLEDCMFCLSGAHYEIMYLNNENIHHTKVYSAQKGDILCLGKKTRGFRSYIISAALKSSRLGFEMQDFEKHFKIYTNKIRVCKGPEFEYLSDPDQILNNFHTISKDSSLMGLKLDSNNIKSNSYDIISSAVCDGTIQLTNNGPIILMRHRQTTGGYPRVLQVAAVDINLLAQYKIGERIHFEMISFVEAKKLLREYNHQLDKFKSLF